MAAVKTLEEKIAMAEETARKQAEKEGLDEVAMKVLIDKAVQKVEDAEAVKCTPTKTGIFIISVENNNTYCGVGAGGIQFANGKAEIKNQRMAEWFSEHKGYSVVEE